MAIKPKMLLAIVYEAGTGADTDRLLTNLANRTQEEAGLRLAGTVQRAFERADRCACDMVVRNLSTNEELKISEDRGTNARGCRLDSRMLEALVGSTEVALGRGVDLVIINKFGKQEALGGGFRHVIATALADGIPTVVAVNLAYLESWRCFAGDLADELPPQMVKIHKWLADRLPDQAHAALFESSDVVADQDSCASRNSRP
jgi:hypothetical protein